jgi:hypothetical protein
MKYAEIMEIYKKSEEFNDMDYDMEVFMNSREYYLFLQIRINAD